MIEAGSDFVEWLRTLPPGGIYAVVFVVAWAENVIPPIPGDLVVVIAGSFVALGTVGLVPTFALATAGSVLGFMSVFAAGRRLGAAVHDPTRLRWIPRGAVATVDTWLARWGLGVVAANRFLSGGRAVIGLLAGASGMPASPAALWSLVSALAWNGILVGGGLAVGTQWPRVMTLLATYGRIVTGVLAVAVLVFGVRWWITAKRRRQNGTGRADRRQSA